MLAGTKRVHHRLGLGSNGAVSVAIGRAATRLRVMRLIPMMEVAAASVATQRSSMTAAAGSAGIHSPAAYMRQAMDRNSRSSTSPAHATTTSGTTYAQARTTERSSERTASTTSRADEPSIGGEGRTRTRREETTGTAGGTTYAGQAGARASSQAHSESPRTAEAPSARP